MPIFLNPDPQRTGKMRFIQDPLSQALGQVFRRKAPAPPRYFSRRASSDSAIVSINLSRAFLASSFRLAGTLSP